MGRIKKFAELSIRSITGGKDPARIVEEFILRHHFDPDACAQEKTPEHARWMVKLETGDELEILVEGLKTAHETTVYMGLNVLTVPIRGAQELLAVALEIADGLVGIKVSLVGHFLVLSSTLAASSITNEALDYHFRLITAQQDWFRKTIAKELGWEEPVAE